MTTSLVPGSASNHYPVDCAYHGVYIYIQPQSGEASRLLEKVVQAKDLVEQTSDNFRLAAAAAGFGLLLRESKYRGDLDWASLQQLADSVVGHDPHGYRKELCLLIRNASGYLAGLQV